MQARDCCKFAVLVVMLLKTFSMVSAYVQFFIGTVRFEKGLEFAGYRIYPNEMKGVLINPEYVKHLPPKYESESQDFDLAILQLSTPIPASFGAKYKAVPICIPRTVLTPQSTLRIAGWGLIRKLVSIY